MLKLFEKAKMPSSPDIASRILGLMDDPNATASSFAEAIRTDPALTSRLLRTVNSVHYAQREPATTVERAVTVLGLNRVKTICLGFQLVGHLDRLGGVPFDMKRFWQHSLLRACLARGIAKRIVPRREEEAFLIGLLQDCGVLLLAQSLGNSYSELYGRDLSPTAFHSMERETFPHTHADAIAALAFEWNLPDIIATPLASHHERVELSETATEQDMLRAVSYFVGALRFTGDPNAEPQESRDGQKTGTPSSTLTGTNWDREEESLPEYVRKTLGIDEAKWTAIQQQACDEFQRMSTMYAEVLPDQVDTAELLGDANRHLASLAAKADQRVQVAETDRATMRKAQHRLQDSLRDYRERASTDPLTNVANRGAIVEVARRAIEANLDKGTPIGVLFLDIDNFKRLNDTFGHRAGDNVLKVVAGLLTREVGAYGMVGRYGGEEFVIVMPDRSAQETRQLGERIVREVRAIDTQPLGVTGAVTCSVGGYWTESVPEGSAEFLFAAADSKMYEAKKSGKDRFCFKVDVHASTPPAVDGHGAVGTAIDDRPTPTTHEAKGRRHAPDLLALAKKLNDADDNHFDGQRKQARATVEIPCTLYVFTQSGSEMRTIKAVSRSMSSGGAGLIVARPMVRGEAVEIVFHRTDEKLYVAGLVAFCRHLGDGVHEIGIQFVSHSAHPMISGSPDEALESLEWVANALHSVQSTGSAVLASR